MKIRYATRNDIPAMLELGRGIHAESRFADMPYDEAKLREGLGELIHLQEQAGSHCFLVAESGDARIVGGFIGALETYFFTRATSANSILIWVDPAWRGSSAAMRMIDAFRRWAAQRQASEVCLLVASGVTIKRTDRFFRRLGFVQTGGNYSMAIT
ncbi:MAG: GNAT family N-acetyltransferase [Pseudomonadota bacterium]|nr:GNAT family N-acetyltransferase [Pseudomonadota bacterium]MDP2351990.1 GNAT family N-acetyltransferase [Pseudomonadota bacterium]